MEVDLFELCNHLYTFLYFHNTSVLLLIDMKLIKNRNIGDKVHA